MKLVETVESQARWRCSQIMLGFSVKRGSGGGAVACLDIVWATSFLHVHGYAGADEEVAGIL